MAEISEYDRQMAIFKKKTLKPDRVIKAHSVLTYKDKDDVVITYFFLSNDDTVTMVDMSDEEAGEQHYGRQQA